MGFPLVNNEAKKWDDIYKGPREKDLNKFFFNVYLFLRETETEHEQETAREKERERAREREREREKERETQNLSRLQALHCQHRA